MKRTLLALLLAAPLSAQARVPDAGNPLAVRPYAPFLGERHRVAPSAAPMNLVSRENYSIEGAVIGGAAAGILVGAMTHDLCGQESSSAHCTLRTLGGGLVGALMGCVVGGLLGSFIPRRAS